jgi:hypothetical protein
MKLKYTCKSHISGMKLSVLDFYYIRLVQLSISGVLMLHLSDNSKFAKQTKVTWDRNIYASNVALVLFPKHVPLGTNDL